MKVFTGFLSCSESKNDVQVVDFFGKLMKAVVLYLVEQLKNPLVRLCQRKSSE